uniref:Cleavage stimulation factor 50 kDa subunit n=1 Tax=Phallusia mammillata TaxID=59560 RepID=A0A6F9DAQ2_9ASCI|nr:cleavage stimulation factor subunit 1 [Phallusia mammillata]
MADFKADEVKLRERLYRSMIGQLLNDGFMGVAKSLTSQVKPQAVCVPSDNLFKAYSVGVEQVDRDKEEKSYNYMDNTAPGSGIDLEFESEVQIISPEIVQYETCYVTAHKAPCRAATFSRNGQYIATGSVDTSIKILDVERMLAKSLQPADITAMMEQPPQGSMADHPVIRTLYDHVDEITCIDFHPTEQVVISGARDYTIKVFDFTKSSAKRASKTIKEVDIVRDLAIHPTGEYLLAATYHPVLRLYDLETFQCFVCNQPSDQHKRGVNCVCYSPTGNIYASGSKDGAIKIWDGVSNRCVSTTVGAHDGDDICSVVFSRNGKYLLTSGKDSVARLWDMAAPSQAVQVYTGAELSGKQVHRAQAVFNHTEDYVLFPDEQTVSMCCWCARTGERQRLLSLGHQGPARRIAHSPTASAFISCSEDFRARFWYKRPGSD